MEPQTKNKPWQNWAIVLGIVLFIYAGWYSSNNDVKESSVETQVNLFPASDSAKNYRLDAYTNIEKHVQFPFSTYRLYSIDRYKWPNADDYTEFENGCTIDSRKESSVCIASDGREYKVEVITPQESDTSVDE